MKKLLFAMLIGAALAWFFDPQSGIDRRDSLKRKLDSMTGNTPPAVSGQVPGPLGTEVAPAVAAVP